MHSPPFEAANHAWEDAFSNLLVLAKCRPHLDPTQQGRALRHMAVDALRKVATARRPTAEAQAAAAVLLVVAHSEEV